MPSGEDDKGARSQPARHVHESETVIPGRGPDPGEAHHAPGDSPTPASAAQLDEFSRSLVEIGLIDEAGLLSFAADSAEGVLGLSRALVKAGKLTPYQAAAVYQKKSRGLLIGNYLILDKLGQGGMGVVFKARHRRLGRVGALKILPPSFARDKDAVMRFRREVEAAGRLKHPNLVAAQDADEDRGVHFLVMDYVEGRDLDRVVRDRGPMPVTQAIDCLIQAARGLDAAHSQGIIHRDIKPANLMLDDAGTVRVLDLGLARIVDASNPFGKSTAGRLTQSGMYMGTIDYMAPEQAEDSHRVDHRADIYSLGCTVHYLLTGQEPFLGATVLKKLMAHMERPAPSLRVTRPDVPEALDAVYLKMMAKRPEARPASMSEVISLLETCKAAAADAKAPAAAPPKSKPELMVFNEQPIKRAGAPRAKSDPSIFVRPKDAEGQVTNDELDLEDLVMDVRPEPPPSSLPPTRRPAPARGQPLTRIASTRSRGRPSRQPLVVFALSGVVAVSAAVVGYVWSRSGDRPHPKAVDAAASDAPDPGTPVDPEPTTDPKREGAGGFPRRQTTVQSLLTGNDLTGWFVESGVGNKWRVEDGDLVVTGTGDYRKLGWLLSDRSFSDFILRFEFQLSKGANSGVALRAERGDRVGSLPVHPEVSLLDTDKRLEETGTFEWSNSLNGQDFVPLDRRSSLRPVGSWNELEIELRGQALRVRINDSDVLTKNLGRLAALPQALPGVRRESGHVGFQAHTGTVRFRNIRIEELTATPANAVNHQTSESAVPKTATTPIPVAAANPHKVSPEDALAGYGKALSASPDDSRLLIARGRLLAGLGRWSQADADFTRAAQLAPDEPQRFVDAGWWVAGPYPPDFKTPAPLESDPAPDPSRPPAVPGTEPRRWQSVGTEPRGKVDLGAVFHAENIAAYALAIVYSASEREVAVVLGNDDPANYWLNGRHFLDAPFISMEHTRTVLMTLRPGRNTILAKVINQRGDHSVSLRFSEAPAERVRAYASAGKWAQAADNYKKLLDEEPGKGDKDTHEAAGRACAELGRWKDAVAAFERAYKLEPGNYATCSQLLRCYLAHHDAAPYQRLCKELVGKYGKDQNPVIRNNAIWTAALLPDALPNYSEVVQIASKLMDIKGTGATQLNTYGALLYRARQYKAAISHLNKSIEARKGNGDAFDWVILAMAKHRLKEPGDKEALNRAVALGADPKMTWQVRAEIRALLDEATLQLTLP